MQWLAHAPGACDGGSSTCALPKPTTAVVVVGASSQDPCGQPLLLKHSMVVVAQALLEPATVGAVVGACSGISQLQWQLTPAAKAHIGSVLLSESACTGEEGPIAVLPLPSCAPPTTAPHLYGRPRLFLHTPSVGAEPHSSPFRLSLCSQAQSSSWICPLKPELQHPAPAHTSECASQAGESTVVAPTICAGLSPFCPPKTGCCALFLGSKAPPPSWLISLLVKGLPRVWEPFFFQSSLPGAQVLSQLLSLFFLFCPTWFYGDFLALSEV